MVPRKELKEGRCLSLCNRVRVCYLLWPTSCLKELQTSMAAEESEGSEFSSEKQRQSDKERNKQ